MNKEDYYTKLKELIKKDSYKTGNHEYFMNVPLKTGKSQFYKMYQKEWNTNPCGEIGLDDSLGDVPSNYYAWEFIK